MEPTRLSPLRAELTLEMLNLAENAVESQKGGKTVEGAVQMRMHVVDGAACSTVFPANMVK